MDKIWTSAEFSDPGGREINEDAAAAAAEGDRQIFVVCDGLGGHRCGEIASHLAADRSIQIFRHMAAQPEFDMSVCLSQCFELSESAVLSYQSSHPEAGDMKTTMVILLRDGDRVQWGHIGDSRLYLFKNGKMRFHTQDHSVPQMLAAAGEIREKDIRFHPDRSRLLRVIGTPWQGRKYVLGGPAEMSGAESFLLCTDGYWEWIIEKEMSRSLAASASPEEWLWKMNEKIRKAGAGKEMDNYTGIAVFCRKSQGRGLFGWMKMDLLS